MRIEEPTPFEAAMQAAIRHITKQFVAIQTRHRERYIKAWLAYSKLPPTMVELRATSRVVG